MYSLGFNGYIDCIEGLQINIVERKMNFATFISKTKKGIFKNSYYACLKDKNHVKNTIKFNKNHIITGPNASGKTTILKSTLINIIFTQQFGCGFYDSAKIAPFKHLHCYLNIPDTSGRDSLFQAEARRCKEILDAISDNKDESHFCAFDELYSGTNPEEAEMSATAFMRYLQKFKNVSSLLTTHFIKVCKKLEKVNGIKNCKMVAEKINNTIKYTYKLENGISEVKGGINVLKDMNYPKEIINNTILADIR
jgi:DNA mismatch repair ATPase MutS